MFKVLTYLCLFWASAAFAGAVKGDCSSHLTSFNTHAALEKVFSTFGSPETRKVDEALAQEISEMRSRLNPEQMELFDESLSGVQEKDGYDFGAVNSSNLEFYIHPALKNQFFGRVIFRHELQHLFDLITQPKLLQGRWFPISLTLKLEKAAFTEQIHFVQRHFTLEERRKLLQETAAALHKIQKEISTRNGKLPAGYTVFNGSIYAVNLEKIGSEPSDLDIQAWILSTLQLQLIMDVNQKDGLFTALALASYAPTISREIMTSPCVFITFLSTMGYSILSDLL